MSKQQKANSESNKQKVISKNQLAKSNCHCAPAFHSITILLHPTMTSPLHQDNHSIVATKTKLTKTLWHLFWAEFQPNYSCMEISLEKYYYWTSLTFTNMYRKTKSPLLY